MSAAVAWDDADDDAWSEWRRDRLLTLMAQGQAGVVLAFEGGPYGGMCRRVPHVDWTIYVVAGPGGEDRLNGMPPDWEPELGPGDAILGRYAFARDTEGMRWIAGA